MSREHEDRLRRDVLELVDRHPNNAKWIGFLEELICDLEARIEAAKEEAE